MNTSFRFVALDSGRFAALFALPDSELAQLGVSRVRVDAKPGFPCRVSLADAEIGETVLLVPFTHHDVASAYRASGPIFVRADVSTASPAVGEIPRMFQHRLLSLRAYDSDATMMEAEVVSGSDLALAITNTLSNPRVSYLHVHNAKPGCFNCSVIRA